MKKIASIIIVMVFFLNISGQDVPNKSKSVNDTTFLPLNRNYPALNPAFGDRLSIPELKISQKTDNRELTFPGASRYYAIWPVERSSAYDRSFVVKPDSVNRYYLIIEDPLKPGIKK